MAAALVGASLAGGDARRAPVAAIVAADYDLGVRQFPQPGLPGRLKTMPIRLWGTVAAPSSPGPHPVVLVAHGAHGDNCPIDGEFDTWPCWKVERRNDLGFRYLVRALAAAGFVAVAMDVNAAYTGAWGEIENQEQIRFGQIFDATLAELTLANAGSQPRFGVPLTGQVDTSRLGLIGHSRGGMNVLRWGKTKRPAAVLLVAPFFDPAQRLPNVPSAVLLGTCDGDTKRTGAGYVIAAAKPSRSASVVQLTLRGANHNYYNQTLVAQRRDDSRGAKGACVKPKRLTGPAQESFLRSIAVDHFVASMLGATPASWITGPISGKVYGQTVTFRRFGT